MYSKKRLEDILSNIDSKDCSCGEQSCDCSCEQPCDDCCEQPCDCSCEQSCDCGCDSVTLAVGPTGPTGPQGPTGTLDTTVSLLTVEGTNGTAALSVGDAIIFQSADGTISTTVSQGSAIIDISATNSAATFGPTGAPGPTGATGMAGSIGPAGPAGIPGIKGATGATGLAGPAGTAGIKGATGATGLAGLAGTAGIKGATGATGLAGTAGIKGATGATGPAGTAGIKGATGPTGPNYPAITRLSLTVMPEFYNNGSYYYKNAFNEVTIVGRIQTYSPNVFDTNQYVASVPAGYRPKAQAIIPVTAVDADWNTLIWNNAGAGILIVSPDGTIDAFVHHNPLNNPDVQWTTIYFNGTYLAEQ